MVERIQEWTPSVTWQEVIGRNNWKSLWEGSLLSEQLLAALKTESLCRFLLVGKAGSGRHTMAEAAASSLKERGYRCFRTDGFSLSGSQPGEGKEGVAECFQLMAKGPSVLLLEEAQELSAEAAYYLARAAQTLEEEKAPAVFLLLYEKEEQIPDRMRRGFLLCRVTPPAGKERLALLEKTLSGRAVLSVDLNEEIRAGLTEGMSCGEVKQTAELALRVLYAETKQQLYGNEAQAADAIQKGLSRLSVSQMEAAARLTGASAAPLSAPAFSAMPFKESAASGSSLPVTPAAAGNGAADQTGSFYQPKAAAAAPAPKPEKLSEDIRVDDLPADFDF